MRIRITEDDEGNIAKTNFWNPHYLITEPPVFAFARVRNICHLLVPDTVIEHFTATLVETVKIVSTSYRNPSRDRGYLTLKLQNGKNYVISDALLAPMNIPIKAAGSATLRIWTSENEQPHLLEERPIHFEIIDTKEDADAEAEVEDADVKSIVDWHPIGSVPPEFFAGTDEQGDLQEVSYQSGLGVKLEYDSVDLYLSEIKSNSTCENAVKLFAATTDTGRRMIGLPVFQGILLIEDADSGFDIASEEISFDLELPITPDISLMDMACRSADSEGIDAFQPALEKACSEGRVFFVWMWHGIGRFHILEQSIPDAIFVERAKVTKKADQQA